MTTGPISTTAAVSPLEPHLGFVCWQVPALASPWALLDTAGDSQMRRGVTEPERFSAHLLSTSVQPGAGDTVSQEASARVAAADPREVVLSGCSPRASFASVLLTVTWAVPASSCVAVMPATWRMRPRLPHCGQNHATTPSGTRCRPQADLKPSTPGCMD